MKEQLVHVSTGTLIGKVVTVLGDFDEDKTLAIDDYSAIEAKLSKLQLTKSDVILYGVPPEWLMIHLEKSRKTVYLYDELDTIIPMTIANYLEGIILHVHTEKLAEEEYRNLLRELSEYSHLFETVEAHLEYSGEESFVNLIGSPWGLHGVTFIVYPCATDYQGKSLAGILEGVAQLPDSWETRVMPNISSLIQEEETLDKLLGSEAVAPVVEKVIASMNAKAEAQVEAQIESQVKPQVKPVAKVMEGK